MASALLSHQDTFVYGPDLSRHEMRLLRLEPGRGALRCTLTVHRLETKPRYEALSYAWGAPRKAHAIVCNGRRLHVARNLFWALCQLRRNGQTAPLWVDALCINQASETEKSVQVRIMRAIYAGADRVRVWLGLAQDTDEAGLALLRRVYRVCGPSRPHDQQKDFRTLQQLGLPAEDDPAWRALAAILYRPYFSRVWIVQEILVARRRTVLLGPFIVEGRVVLALGGALERFPCIELALGASVPVNASWAGAGPMWNGTPSPSPGPLPSMGGSSAAQPIVVGPSLKCLWFLQSVLSDTRELLMIELLNNTRMFEATDPRDRIFALVGLASDLPPAFARRLVDYEKSLADVQTELAAWYLGYGRRRDSLILSYVDSMGHNDKLSSWVPDWAGCLRVQCSLAATWHSYEDLNSMPNPRVNRRIISASRLKLSCTTLDQVASTVDHAPYMVPPTSLLTGSYLAQNCLEMEAWNHTCWNLTVRINGPHCYAATGESLFEAYWRTLVFDRDSEHRGCSASPDLGASYRMWISTFQTFNQLQRLAHSPSPGLGRPHFVALLCILLSQQALGRRFDAAFKRYLAGRKFCATSTGYIGWVPMTAREGDTVCFFEGNHLPFVIRRCEMQGYRLVGDCYVHGMMSGPQTERLGTLRSKNIVLF